MVAGTHRAVSGGITVSTFNGREYFFVEVETTTGFANERESCVASVADSSVHSCGVRARLVGYG